MFVQGCVGFHAWFYVCKAEKQHKTHDISNLATFMVSAVDTRKRTCELGHAIWKKSAKTVCLQVLSGKLRGSPFTGDLPFVLLFSSNSGNPHPMESIMVLEKAVTWSWTWLPVTGDAQRTEEQSRWVTRGSHHAASPEVRFSSVPFKSFVIRCAGSRTFRDSLFIDELIIISPCTRSFVF